jgi:RNA polymerase-associated protein
MPVDPIQRAQFRLALYRIERDWYALAQLIDEDHDKKHVVKNRKILRDAILQSADVFKVKPYFLSDDFSLVDASIAPILWRMRHYELELPPQAQALIKYASTVFARPSFRASLSDVEIQMRAD